MRQRSAVLNQTSEAQDLSSELRRGRVVVLIEPVTDINDQMHARLLPQTGRAATAFPASRHESTVPRNASVTPGVGDRPVWWLAAAASGRWCECFEVVQEVSSDEKAATTFISGEGRQLWPSRQKLLEPMRHIITRGLAVVPSSSPRWGPGRRLGTGVVFRDNAEQGGRSPRIY